MAVKTPKKTKADHLTDARSAKTKDLSPKWDGHESMTADEFSKHFRVAMQWYNLEKSAKELKPKVIDWMGRNDYPKDIIKQFKSIKDWHCTLTMGSVAANLIKGMPAVREDFNHGRDTAAWLRDQIARVLEEGKNDLEAEAVIEVKPSFVPSIQDRLRDASLKMTDEIEDALVAFTADPDTFEPKAFKLLNLLKGRQAKAAHARIIKGLYVRQYAELQEAYAGKDDQLKEGYGHISKKNLRKLVDFYSEIISACDMLGQEAKVNRKPKAKKAVPAEKVVAKLKFKKTDEATKLVSINPIDIVGAKELWLFDTKTRKLGKYVAAEYQDLSVKGTSITGFDENKSVQKTLRKPVEQLKDFKAAGKVALRKFLDEINAVDIKLNGRINENQILLRVD
jgi:hypothetical protein